MNTSILRELGDELYDALRSGTMLPPLTSRLPELTIEDAYQISRHMLERRIAGGERVIGKKIGVTSRPVQQMLNTDAMHVANGATVSLRGAGLIQPRAEGEIAFLLAHDLTGGNVTAEDVLDATEAVMPCFEIVDSRIRDWQIKIQDTVADNASCGVFVLGDARVGPRDIDLAAAELTMSHNGKTVATGLGSAVQGHPAAAVAWLANTLGRFGIPFRKGEIILSGSLVPLVPAAAGDRFDLSIAGIGTASIAFSA
jgi:2-oxopent-4-enoate/cis-2-oxohex-4-enoate hydratase